MYATIHSSSTKHKITRMNEIIKIKEISKQKEGQQGRGRGGKERGRV